MDIFADEYVPNEEASTGHKNWVKANKGEAAKWATFRDKAIAYSKGDPPVTAPAMATKHGKALVAAGKEHMSVTDLGAVWETPATPLPTNITAGGTYSGTVNGSGASPAVRITTSSPVTILNSTITHSSATGTLVECTQTGAEVTLRNCFLNGTGPGGRAGRAFYITDWKSVLVENCTINGTWGIRINTPQAGATSVRVTKCKFTNQLSDVSGLHCIQFAEWGALGVSGTCEIDWNWCVNQFQLSNMEDPISLFRANGVNVHDNMIDGGYPATLTSSYSGTGTVIADFGGDNNSYHDNTVVACINGGVGISGGSNNHVYNNRIISDGRDDNGNEFTHANVGLICYTTTPGNNNTLYGNFVGWMQGSSFGHPISRADYYCPTADNNVAADNTYAHGDNSTPMTKADEDAERTLWAAKVANAGVIIGAR